MLEGYAAPGKGLASHSFHYLGRRDNCCSYNEHVPCA